MLLNSVKGANCACIAERQMNQTLASQFHLGHDSVLGTILPIEWLPQQSRIVLGNYPLSYLNCILMAPLQTCLVTLFDCFFGCDSSICVIRKIYSDIKRCNIYIRTLQVRCIPCTWNSTSVRESYPRLTDNQTAFLLAQTLPKPKPVVHGGSPFRKQCSHDKKKFIKFRLRGGMHNSNANACCKNWGGKDLVTLHLWHHFH